MDGIDKTNEIRPDTKIVDNGEPIEIQALGQLFQGVVEPLVKSQEIAATEGTKRAEILAKVAHRGLFYFFTIAFMILVIATIALFLGKDQLAEKIIFGVITFIGGLGIGKSMPKNG